VTCAPDRWLPPSVREGTESGLAAGSSVLLSQQPGSTSPNVFRPISTQGNSGVCFPGLRVDAECDGWCEARSLSPADPDRWPGVPSYSLSLPAPRRSAVPSFQGSCADSDVDDESGRAVCLAFLLKAVHPCPYHLARGMPDGGHLPNAPRLPIGLHEPLPRCEAIHGVYFPVVQFGHS